MALRDLVIQSQLIPPRQRRGVLRRPRLEARLAAVLDHPVTLVQAGTGYGKSTALTALTDMACRLCWYTITEPDRDPLLFLAHLICAFARQEPNWSKAALHALQESGGRVTARALTPLLNTLTEELDDEAVLVLDDYHLVADVPEIADVAEHLVDYVPPRLHIVISSRKIPPLPALTRWHVKGQLLSITREDLAFTAAEIQTLFREEYGHTLSLEQAKALAIETEGWAIALQLVWQSLQSGSAPNLEAVLGQLPTTLEALFDYLAQDVLARQPADVQHFLVTTSVLRQMDGPACDHLLEGQGSAARLRRLQEAGLFVVSMGDEVYRYHRLFHDFLGAQLDRIPPQGRAQGLHHRAAEYFEEAGHPEETVYHLLEAHEYAGAAELIAEIGPGLVELGRLDSLSAWITRLPMEVRAAGPGLELLMGDVLRLRARFDEALEHYVAAERRYAEGGNRPGRSQALRGQAQVFLDTVRPLKADSLLEEALRLLEPQEHREETAALLDQLAENKLNLGHPHEAEALHHEARLLRAETDPGDLYLEARAMLRTGRLSNAQGMLAQRAEEERRGDHSRPQRFHRETLLLLSLVDALQGDAAAAEQHAREGIAIGQQLGSSFVEAVGYMRLGHARQLQRRRPWEEQGCSVAGQAMACYERAIEQVRAFKVLRTQVEPLWGLCRACGYSGDLLAAERYADQGLEIAARAGDEWICNLIRVAMGAGYALAGASKRAGGYLERAADGFGQVGDVFGRAAAWLWQALDAWWQGDTDGAMEHVSDLLPLIQEEGNDLLVTRRTFLGLEDDQAAIPLLIEARRRGIEARYAGDLLAGMGLAEVEYHPGYTLSVRTLGPFATWRGREAVTAGDWKREKARQVFQLFVTHQGQWLYREQAADQLWPHLPPEAAERDFKVALSALGQALEPDRPRGAQPFFVVRRGNVYGLNPAAGVVVDADDFERLAAADEVELLREALSLYEEDYLPDSLYEDWPSARRQRLRHLYLAAAERLARLLLRAEAFDETVQVCQSILARDMCRETAYRLLMRAHAAKDNRSQVHSIYQRCATTLREELGVEPSLTTQALFEQLS
jgi:LuxR family maltose regulon positive regulatory protein